MKLFATLFATVFMLAVTVALSYLSIEFNFLNWVVLTAIGISAALALLAAILLIVQIILAVAVLKGKRKREAQRSSSSD